MTAKTFFHVNLWITNEYVIWNFREINSSELLFVTAMYFFWKFIPKTKTDVCNIFWLECKLSVKGETTRKQNDETPKTRFLRNTPMAQKRNHLSFCRKRKKMASLPQATWLDGLWSGIGDNRYKITSYMCDSPATTQWRSAGFEQPLKENMLDNFPIIGNTLLTFLCHHKHTLQLCEIIFVMVTIGDFRFAECQY